SGQSGMSADWSRLGEQRTCQQRANVAIDPKQTFSLIGFRG
ncbi:MAG: hypothetical protein QOE78_2525, partial [Alphaproteobacteria bacterium]|nr:hypothetical protein [Alphaproteobacteria bacterium]